MGARRAAALWLCLLAAGSAAAGGAACGPSDVDAARGVVARVFPALSSRVSFACIAADADTFEYGTELAATAGQVLLTVKGTNGVAMASGAYWYLKHVCNCAHVAWGNDGTGRSVRIPAQLPWVHAPVRRASPFDWKYYFNVCTFSYSAFNWDWARWEEEIDWMALHGINMPLAFTGTEYAWTVLFEKLGLQWNQFEDYFTGPAFLAWNRMGNLQQWAGPVNRKWVAAQGELQRRILRRERSLGMRPVLPCFAGHVPAAVVAKFPGASHHHASNWWSRDPCPEAGAAGAAGPGGVWLAGEEKGGAAGQQAGSARFSCVLQVRAAPLCPAPNTTLPAPLPTTHADASSNKHTLTACRSWSPPTHCTRASGRCSCARSPSSSAPTTSTTATSTTR